MQDTNTHTQAPMRESNTIFYSTLVFLILVVVSTVGLWGMTYMAKTDITKTQKAIEVSDIEIGVLSKDRRIVIAKILRENTIRPSIDLKKIVTDFRLASIRANVSFDGFAIKNDTITTRMTSFVGTQSHPDPAATIVNMMNQYARDDNTVFALGTISTVSGDAKRRITDIEFTLRTPSNPQ